MRKNTAVEHRKTLLRLVFPSRLEYCRNSGYRTAEIALPFRLFGGFGGGKYEVVDLDGPTSNQLFKTLEDWSTYLARLKPEFGEPTP